MAYVAPASEVYLIKNCPLDIGREHTIKFASASAQQTYFQSNVRATHHWGDYVRINPLDNVIRLGLDYASVYQCNYVAFRNAATLYEQKWYYAFIVECNYINEGTTEIVYSLDYMQTYLFDFKVLPSMIEREHTKTDTVGGNIVPEGLDIGEYVCNKTHKDNNNNTLNSGGYIPCHVGDDIVYIVICTLNLIHTIEHNRTHLPPTSVYYPLSTYYPVGNVYNGVGVYVFPTADYLSEGLKLIEEKADSIAAVFPFPSALIDWTCVHWRDEDDYIAYTVGRLYDTGTATSVKNIALNDAISYQYYKFVQGSGYVLDTKTVRSALYIPLFGNENIDGYKPWNNKMYTAPFCWIEVDGKTGSTALYRPELFNTRIDLGFLASPSAEPVIFAYPRYYRGITENHEEGVSKNNAYPYCAYQYDVFKNWLQQNQNSLALSFMQGAVTGVLGAASASIGHTSLSTYSKEVEGEIPQLVQPRAKGKYTKGWEVKTTPINLNESATREVQYKTNPAEIALRGLGGFGQCAAVLANIADHAMIPDTVKGQVNNGSINQANKINDFYIYIKTVRSDYAQKIDDFFSRYGYAVNRFGVPNLFDTNGTPRRRWNYVKTVDCKVDSVTGVGFNHDVEANLEALFDHGITFWNISNGTMYDYTQTNNDNNKPTS